MTGLSQRTTKLPYPINNFSPQRNAHFSQQNANQALCAFEILSFPFRLNKHRAKKQTLKQHAPLFTLKMHKNRAFESPYYIILYPLRRIRFISARISLRATPKGSIIVRFYHLDWKTNQSIFCSARLAHSVAIIGGNKSRRKPVWSRRGANV
jgi:hypothetical protein